MATLQEEFRERFVKFFRLSKHADYKSISIKSGASPSVAQKIATGAFDESRNGPGIFLVDRLCGELGCSPNDLLGYTDTTKDEGISIEGLIKRSIDSGRRLSGFEDCIDRLQVYKEPRDGQVNLVWSGHLSLASRAAGTVDLPYLQAQFFSFDKATRGAIYRAHMRAWHAGMDVDVQYLDHKMADIGRVAKFYFVRVCFRVRDEDGPDKLAVYCSIIS